MNSKCYKHKKTGKLYELVQEKILIKDKQTFPEYKRYKDKMFIESNYPLKWRGNDDNDTFVLYRALYENPNGPYFIRLKDDFFEKFELVD